MTSCTRISSKAFSLKNHPHFEMQSQQNPYNIQNLAIFHYGFGFIINNLKRIILLLLICFFNFHINYNKLYFFHKNRKISNIIHRVDNSTSIALIFFYPQLAFTGVNKFLFVLKFQSISCGII